MSPFGSGTAAGGAAAEWLLATLDAGGPNGRTIAVLGIGTNLCDNVHRPVLPQTSRRPLSFFLAGFGL
jgi:hypothetical protein